MIYGKNLFGLTIESEIELPGFVSQPDWAAPDIGIRRGRVSLAARDNLKRVGPAAHAASGICIQSIPDIARVEIQHGRSIIVDPDPAANLITIQTFLLGTPIGVALLQRCLLVLHGNAIIIDGRAIVCIGASGAGKSTLAKAMLDRGHGVLTDDLCVVSPDLSVLPGVPRIKLWRKSVEHLGAASDNLQPVRPDVPKFALPFGQDDEVKSTPLEAVIHLVPADIPDIVVSEVEGLEKFSLLRSNVFKRNFVQELGVWPKLVPQIGDLATAMKMYRIKRSKSGFDVENLIQAVENIHSKNRCSDAEN